MPPPQSIAYFLVLHENAQCERQREGDDDDLKTTNALLPPLPSNRKPSPAHPTERVMKKHTRTHTTLSEIEVLLYSCILCMYLREEPRSERDWCIFIIVGTHGAWVFVNRNYPSKLQNQRQLTRTMRMKDNYVICICKCTPIYIYMSNNIENNCLLIECLARHMK